MGTQNNILLWTVQCDMIVELDEFSTRLFTTGSSFNIKHLHFLFPFVNTFEMNWAQLCEPVRGYLHLSDRSNDF